MRHLLLVLLAACTDASPAKDTALGEIVLEAPDTRVHEEFRSLIYASWEQPEEATTWIRYAFDGTTLESPHTLTPPGGAEVLLLGIPYGVDASLVVVNERDGIHSESPATAIVTDALPADLPVPSSVTGDDSLQDPATKYLFMSISEVPARGHTGLTEDWWVLILDREGRVVWSRKTPSDATSLQPRVSWDGRSLLIDESTFWATFDEGAASQLLRMKIDGTIEQTWATPGMHHPYVQIADGSIMWGAADGDNETLEELPPDGVQRRIWSCADALVERGLPATACASNTIAWREADDTLLFSMYSLYSVFEIDRTTGATLRTYGQAAGSWKMHPAASTFWWQHGVYWTAEGTLLVSTYEDAAGSGTVVREYAPDSANETLDEVWNMGIGDGIWGQYMGEPHRLSNGNTLHNTGSEPRLREGTPDGEIVWDVDFAVGGANTQQPWMGRSTSVADLYAFAP